ncbi:hypothetical protein [Rugosimonospora africana]|uniref:Secreted protein n=1 Tax=Rugosimonospora africana TaxID=556532 RepID=A0A8J3QW27_9ACTN|nr:hypothetical protein [Rugosimonospora africana]GIH16880.1 hypothetical protein Raf01_50520 [Rugosimonospora africana]
MVLRSATRRLIIGVAVACTVTVLAGQEPVNAETTSDIAAVSLASGQFQLTDTSYAAATNHLYSAYLTSHATLTDVITTNFTTNSAGATDPWMNLRTMTSCPAGDSGLPTVPTTVAWCWSPSHADDTTAAWDPQGIATTGDADGSDGAIQGDRVVAVSWHYQTASGSGGSGCQTQNLLKLTLIDRDTKEYRHVLLVEPTSTSSTASNYTFVTGHGGGIAWYGDYIYVTDTTHGIRVFDLNKLARVTTYGSNVTTVGISSGKSSACGYAYVVPEVHRYFQPQTPGSCASAGPIDPNYLCFSWLSLDKTGAAPYKLVTGEWYGGVNGGRIVRYQLNPASAATNPGLLTTSGGKTVVQDAYRAVHYDGLQGGMTWTDGNGRLNFAFQKGCGLSPGVFSVSWVGDLRDTTTCASGGNWAAGPPEDLAYWPRVAPMTTDEIWGLTESADGAGIRTVYAIPFTGGPVQNLH